MARALSRNELLGLLAEVGRYLDDRGVTGEIYVVGGAAMALAFDSRRTTTDVDGVFLPTQIIREAAAHVASNSELVDDPDWLNDAAKGLLPPGEAKEGSTVLDIPGLRVIAPPPDYLLATKVFAARADRDVDDIRFLARTVGADTTDKILAIVTAYYPTSQLQPKTRFLIEQMFGPSEGDK
jgi:hypothetical protein